MHMVNICIYGKFILKYIGYGQVGAAEETQISILEHIVFGGI